MTKKRSTKRALLLSALSLLMCVSMLVGSTFAWFTDSVTSGVNKIQAGNLDVELEYKKVVDGVATEWATVKDKTDIFDPNALWEPGRVEVVYLKVSNLGTLQLKYQLGVNVIKETLGKTETGADIKLSDHLVFKVVEINEDEVGSYTRETAKTAAGTVKGLKDYNGTTTALADGEKDYVALIVYMPETVGNEANYRGDAIPTIELGINLYATQYNAESDSFGSDYDKDAWDKALKVTTAAELATAINDVEEGGTVVLVDTIKFNADVRTDSGGGWYEGLNYVGDKSFTIDLNGYTITNESGTLNDRLLRFENDGTKANTITIKNGTLDAVGVYSAVATAGSNAQKVTINLENVKVNLGDTSGSGAAVLVRGGAELNVNAGTIITAANAYCAIECAGGATANIYDGAEIYQNGTSSYCGTLVGASGNGTVNVYGGYGKGVSGGFIVMTSGGTFNISGGEWIANTDGSYANSNKSVLIAQNDKNTYTSAQASIINVTGGTFKGGYNCYSYTVAADAQINISGGNFNADPAAYVATDYKAVAETNGTYTVLPDVGTNLTATGFAGIYAGAAKTYYVADKTGLMNLNALFAKIVPNEANINTVELLADVDLAGESWAPINSMWVTFNGNGHTISNLKAGLSTDGRRSGFWAYAGAVTINDLTLENVDVTGSQVGAFVGSADGTKINNCFLKGDNKITYIDGIEDWNGIGAISGVLTNSNINVTIVDGATVTLNKAGFVTDPGCTFIDNLTGYINPNLGTVTNNGKIAIGVSTAAGLIDAVKKAPVGSETAIIMADGTYTDDINITVAALGAAGGDVVIKAAEGTKPVIAGTVTIGYRQQNVGAASYNAKVTFDGITFDHAESGKHCLNVQDVESFYMVNCTVIGDGEYGLSTPGSNGTGAAKIEKCKFVDAGLQLAGKFAQTLIIDKCEFEESVINVQGGGPLGPTIQNSKFDITLKAAHSGQSFYVIRNSNAGANIKVENCEIRVDAEQGFVGVAGSKGWGVFVNRIASYNMDVKDVKITMTDAALAQPALKVATCLSTGKINMTNVTLNGAVQ